MMKHEFERIAGYSVSWEDYNNIIEPMYNATTLDKSDFVKLLDRKRFEVKPEKSAELIAFEKSINDEIDAAKADIKKLTEDIKRLEMYISIDSDPNWIARWLTDIKADKRRIKSLKLRIKELKWVLGV